MKRALAGLAMAASLLAGCAGSGSGKDTVHYRSTHCDLECQQNIAEAGGESLPPGLVFDVDKSPCSDWTREPDGVRAFLASVYAARLGAGDNASPTLTESFKKAITVACASYTTDNVKHVATTLRNADGQWPDA